MTSRTLSGGKSCRASIIAFALANLSLTSVAAAAMSWPESGPLYLSMVSQHGKAEISVAGACATGATFRRDWGSGTTRKADTGDRGVCVKIASAVDAVRITHKGGTCEVRPGLAATSPSSSFTLTASASAATVDGCSVGEAGAAPAESYGGIIVEFADGYSWSSSYHGAMPDLVQDSAPGTTFAAPGNHYYRYSVDLHLSSGVSPIVGAAEPPASSGGPVQLIERQVDAVKTLAAVPVVAAAERPPAIEAKPVAKPALPTWSTTDGMTFRAQILQWVEQINAAGCGGSDNPCYRVAERKPNDPIEPWRVRITTTFPGDFLTVLTTLRDGFWEDPRPDIEVTKNNVIIIHRLGAQ